MSSAGTRLACDRGSVTKYRHQEFAGYKVVPRHARFVEALPKSKVGKIQRRELRGSF